GGAGTAIGVGAVDTVINIVVGIGPKVIIGIRPEHIVKKVVIDVRPEHRSDPADGETAPPPGPGRTKESAVEPRKPEARLQGRVGDDAIAEYPAPGSGYARACKVISREACRCDARPRRRKGPPSHLAPCLTRWRREDWNRLRNPFDHLGIRAGLTLRPHLLDKLDTAFELLVRHVLDRIAVLDLVLTRDKQGETSQVHPGLLAAHLRNG